MAEDVVIIWGHSVKNSNISRNMSLYKDSYAFCSSRNISYRTSYLMDINFWSSLDSRDVVPVPQPAQKPWRKTWKSMDVARQN